MNEKFREIIDSIPMITTISDLDTIGYMKKINMFYEKIYAYYGRNAYAPNGNIITCIEKGELDEKMFEYLQTPPDASGRRTLPDIDMLRGILTELGENVAELEKIDLNAIAKKIDEEVAAFKSDKGTIRSNEMTLTFSINTYTAILNIYERNDEWIKYINSTLDNIQKLIDKGIYFESPVFLERKITAK